MAIRAKKSDVSAEGDMTPMIDMTFQLIAFFMILINFSDEQQNDRVKLPNSELAKPPEASVESPVTLQVTKEGIVLYGGDEVQVENIGPKLQIEKQLLERGGKTASQAHIIIRAHEAVPTGKVQKLIQLCQDKEFEQFTLRAEQVEPGKM